ncbi:DNA repair protein RecN [Aquincola sp. J276]|uniref:DNA repair protein RecN n=1 Tax=Aquincola sp. J276 TaxID=2898432 RepID=UPI002151A4F8|nr:DNA repair protein RecN [Aquincola sp. J276]MCR5865693.1 DNA repair protein RecN [Aquincola sp. J276]
MLRRLALRDFVIVPVLEIDLQPGFSVLTGETGAGKSILIDALQLALGSRGDAGVVREGAARADITAEFDMPPTLAGWLAEAGFDAGADDGVLLLRRVIDAQGKSRAWVNGNAATLAQLREAAEHLLDIHGQHAWQSLTRPAAVRALLDAQAGIDLQPLTAAWGDMRGAAEALEAASAQRDSIERERERLAWQIGELDKLAPADDEWEELNAEHQRASHAQALLDAARLALDAVAEADTNADTLTSRALDALGDVVYHDARLAEVMEVLRSAQAQLEDAAHTLHGYLGHTEVDPQRLEELDARLGAWMSLARRYRRTPAELPAVLSQWRAELAALDAAADLDALQKAHADAHRRYQQEARQVTQARSAAAGPLGEAVTRAMQQLGMGGGRFEVALLPQEAPQSYGLETVEFRVAGHAGSTPRALAKVASGGELSRLALAIAVTTAARDEEGAGTLIFDEIDAGVGGAVADTVGRLMKQLGQRRQVMAVTHLAQVAACADHHFVVSKAAQRGITTSDVQPVAGEARVSEVARMLGGERLATSLAHAEQLLAEAAKPAVVADDVTAASGKPSRKRSRA